MKVLSNSRIVYLFVYVSDLAMARRFYEDGLGLHAIEEDSSSVKYDAGNVVLALNLAAEYGVSLGPRPDTTLLVFHTADIDATRAELEGRGVSFDRIERYEIGATTACYDPDGHCVTLYEPSEEAMSWPSGGVYRRLLKEAASGRGPGLRTASLVYLFLFVPDTSAAARFYQETLGLRVIEQDDEAGVVKYDAGTFILATHLFEGSVNELKDQETSIAPVFDVPDVDEALRLLGPAFAVAEPPRTSEVGTVALFRDPFGRPFYLYTPSFTAMGWPSGAKLWSDAYRREDAK